MTQSKDANSFWRRGSVVAAVVAASGLAWASATSAQAFNPADLVELKVVDREAGKPLETWRRDGHLFVAGEPGARYSLRVINHSPGRVLVVMSVDGVNVITGETAGYDQRGYVLQPYQSNDVTGWRKSETEVAAFTFASLPQSYAALTGRPGDVGVIGIAVFRERPPPPPMPMPPPPPPQMSQTAPMRGAAAPPPNIAPPPPLPIPPVEKPIQAPPPAAPSPPRARGSAASAAAPAPNASNRASRAPDQARNDKLGTAHGALEYAVSHTVSFLRDTPYPQSVQKIEYDTRANLVAIGVIPSDTYRGDQTQPFPLNSPGGGFVPDPPIH